MKYVIIVALIALFVWVGYNLLKKDHKEASKKRGTQTGTGSKTQPDDIREDGPKEIKG